MSISEVLAGELRADHEVALICFPPAGGAGSFYNMWRRASVDGPVLVVAVQPPGRETRLREPATPDLACLAAEQAEVIERNYAGRVQVGLFGHSMGAVAAWQAAVYLEEKALPVNLLAVSAGLPPSASVTNPVSTLSDDDFVRRVVALGGIPEQFLADQDLLRRLYLPALRHDYRLVETFLGERAGGEPQPIDAPVLALSATRDKRATPEAMDTWRAWTRSTFDSRVFEGGHFYVRPHAETVLELVVNRLTIGNQDKQEST